MAGKVITALADNIEHKLDCLTDELRAYGISHIGHGLIVNNKIPTAYFSSKEWAARYDEEDLVSRDPIRECALNTNYHIIAWDSILLDKEKRKILEERKKAFEGKSGLLISLKTEQFHETFVLGCGSSQYDIFQLFNNNYQIIFEYLLKFRKLHLSYYSQ